MRQFNMQISTQKQITKTRDKMLQPIKSAFREKWAENFKTLASTYYAK